MKKIFILIFSSISLLPSFGWSQEDCLTVFTETEIEHLPITSIKVIDSTTYISTFYGALYTTEDNIITSIDTFDSLGTSPLIKDISGYLNKIALAHYIGSTTEVYLYDKEEDSLEKIIDSDDIILNYQTTDYGHSTPFVIESRDSLLLVGTTSGLLVYDKNNEFYQFQDFDNDGYIEAIFDIDTRFDNHAWLCTNSGLYTIDYETLEITKELEQPCRKGIAKQANEFFFLAPGAVDVLFKYSNGVLSEEAQGNSEILVYRIRNIDVNAEGKLTFITNEYVATYHDQEFTILFDINHGIDLAINENQIIAGGNSTVIISNCSITNIKDVIIKEPTFKIFPNTTEGKLNISLDKQIDLSKTELQIINTTGLKVFNSRVQSHSLNINLSHIPSGLYYTILKTEHGLTTQSFIKL